MARVVIEDPDVHRKGAPVDTRGRVSIGQEHEGKKVTVVVEIHDSGDK